MDSAALHQGLLAEHLAHPLGQRLGTVKDEQQPPAGIQASLDQIAQQPGDHRGVLGVTLIQPDGDLGAIGGDRERDDHQVLPDV
jgi:hypothetical protein